MWNKQKDEPMTRPQPEPIRTTPPAAPQGPVVHTPVRTVEHVRALRSDRVEELGYVARSIEKVVKHFAPARADGEVEGLLESQSLLTVGPNGKVRANIKAREVVIFGSVRGDVEVVEKIAIREQGSLIGNIKSAGISIDDGAYFKGSIDIMRPEPKVTSKPVKNEPKIEAHAS